MKLPARSPLVVAGWIGIAGPCFSEAESAGQPDPELAALVEELEVLAKTMPCPKRPWASDEVVDAEYRRQVAAHPKLAAPFRDIPLERNGFLRTIEFLERHRPAGEIGDKTLGLPDDIRGLVSEEGAWDRARFASWMDANGELVEELLALGALPERSVCGIDPSRYQFLWHGFFEEIAEVLAACARVAAEAGDGARARRFVEAGLGIANQLDGVETPSLLTTTIVMLMRMRLLDRTLQDVIPAREWSREELLAWRRIFRACDHYDPRGLSRIIRGEWHVTSRALALPLLLGADENEVPPAEREEYFAHYARLAELQCDFLDNASMRTLAAQGVPNFPAPPETSDLTRLLVWSMQPASGGWANGWCRIAAMFGQADAAFAILLGEPVPAEPITGLPYHWDRDSRVLRVPFHATLHKLRVDPIVVLKRRDG